MTRSLIKIFFILALGATFVDALDPDEATWNDEARHNNNVSIMILPFALAATTHGIRVLQNWWKGQPVPEIQPGLKNSERDILTYARIALDSSLDDANKQKKDESTKAFLERLAMTTTRLVKPGDGVDIRHQLAKSVVSLYRAVGYALGQADDLRKEVETQTDRVAALGTKVQQFDDVTRLLHPQGNILTDYGLVKAKIREIQHNADLSPIIALLTNDPGGLDTPFKVAEEIKAVLRRDLGDIWNVIPAQYQAGAGPQSLADIEEAVKRLVKAVNRQTAAMSIAPAPAGATNLATILNVWNDLPDAWKQGLPAPQNEQELLDRLRASYPQAQQPQCDHPEDLARHLHFDPSIPWNDSIAEVDRLVSQPGAAPLTAPTTPRLFKIQDVPKFTKRSEYVAYRATLQRFFDSITEPSPDQYGIALNRILTAWDSDEIRRAAANWDVSSLLRDPFGNPRNWSSLKNAFLTACDGKFLEVTAAQDAIAAFLKTRPRKDQKPMDFLLDFEAALALRQTAAQIMGFPQLEAQGIVDRLIQVIPGEVRDQLRLNLANQTPPRIPENLTYDQLRTPLVNAWTYLPKAANGGSPGRSPTVHAASTPGNRQAPGAANQVQTRTCGLRSSYTMAPPVPQHLQGALYYKPGATPEQNNAARGRNSSAIRSDVCEACRRPRSQHPTGTTFKPVKPWREPGQTMALPAATGTPAPPTRPALPPPPQNPSPPPGPRVEEVD